jgi:hypothetical protein
MNTATHTPKPRIALAALLYIGAAALGGVLGYDFARQAGGGMVMALVAGANSALFSTLLADWLAGALASRLTRRR